MLEDIGMTFFQYANASTKSFGTGFWTMLAIGMMAIVKVNKWQTEIELKQSLKCFK